MHQLTLRIDPVLAEQLKREAAARSTSVNAFVQTVLSAALDPDLAGDELTRMRERLARAGVLAEPPIQHGGRPDEDELARARAAAGHGTPLSDLVSEGRD